MIYTRQYERWQERRDSPLCRQCRWGKQQGKQSCGMEPERRETGAQQAVQSWLNGNGDGACPCYEARPMV